ncbi:hypothetical protein FHS21_003148 [Phyllobacterium trifolii]|uniref:DUF982 domain-containing protein n=1 Tax=Phyllobacterium trifolii TaxID=300193 RepID=A0A839UCX6_9HYPH|nr:DUF982 domain-containing protein [Phyllobacterium trifolii]MBB3146732.1 hypothetical protein [Phyllobacterium trifolii]
MPKQPFSSVNIELDSKTQIVSSVEQAAGVLVFRWPHKDGPYYKRALRTCMDAYAGRSSIDCARTAFIDAALEVDIYVSQRLVRQRNWQHALARESRMFEF